MLDEAVVDRLIPEIYTRLLMMGEDWEYEIAVPERKALLSMSGGPRNSIINFSVIQTLDNGDRLERPSVSFHHVERGTITVAEKEYPNIRVVSVDNSALELYEWLRSDPFTEQGSDESEGEHVM